MSEGSEGRARLESLTIRLLEALGYQGVKLSADERSDSSVIAEFAGPSGPPTRVLVEWKLGSTDLMGRPEVEEFHSTLRANSAARWGILATSGRFSEEALEYARQTGTIALVDEERLRGLLSGAEPRGERVPAPAEAQAPRATRWWIALALLLRDALETVLLSLGVFWLITTFVVQTFRVVGSSMEPALHDSQYLIVNKLAYRLYQPQRGDIVVFDFPLNIEREFIKRMIGLPGEKVELKGGQVYINGELLKEDYIPHLGNSSWGPKVLGANEFFMLGDNRLNSHDSRSWGILPRQNLTGKAWFSYWPLQHWGSMPNISFASPK